MSSSPITATSTFETLIDRFGIRDRAVQKLAELIHDADLEDESFREAFLFRLKLGFISFGGPTGQIAVMHTDLVEKKKWISEARFLRALNYCMLLPGPEGSTIGDVCRLAYLGRHCGRAFFVIPL
jgi:chromate transport protein ChrA